ncbi:MAG: hypothetical protein WAV00_16685 [Nocardioides sp.]
MSRGVGATGEVLVATLVTLAVVVGGVAVYWLRPAHDVRREQAETLQWSGRFGPTMSGHWAKLVFDGYTETGNPQLETQEPVRVEVSVAGAAPVQVMVLSAGYPVRPRLAPAGADGTGQFVITPSGDACLVPILVYVRGVTPTSPLTSAKAVVTYRPLGHTHSCAAGLAG